MQEDVAVVRVADLVYWTEEEARVVVDAWRRSGESYAAFGRRYGIEPRRVSAWARRLEEHEVDFHPVRVVNEPQVESAARIEIVLPRGGSILVPPGFVGEDLRRVLQVVNEQG